MLLGSDAIKRYFHESEDRGLGAMEQLTDALVQNSFLARFSSTNSNARYAEMTVNPQL